MTLQVLVGVDKAIPCTWSVRALLPYFHFQRKTVLVSKWRVGSHSKRWTSPVPYAAKSSETRWSLSAVTASVHPVCGSTGLVDGAATALCAEPSLWMTLYPASPWRTCVNLTSRRVRGRRKPRESYTVIQGRCVLFMGRSSNFFACWTKSPSVWFATPQGSTNSMIAALSAKLL